eukprot:26261-Rhodomonas_salina.2
MLGSSKSAAIICLSSVMGACRFMRSFLISGQCCKRQHARHPCQPCRDTRRCQISTAPHVGCDHTTLRPTLPAQTRVKCELSLDEPTLNQALQRRGLQSIACDGAGRTHEGNAKCSGGRAAGGTAKTYLCFASELDVRPRG